MAAKAKLWASLEIFILPPFTRSLRNHNRLLWEFPGCIGVKTGYTRPSQQVLASAALREGREVISVIMHSDKPGIWEDSKLLLTYGFDHPPTAESLAPRRTAAQP